VAVTREQRQTQREPAVRALFGKNAWCAMELLELLEIAWHDCYGEVTPPEQVVSDVLTCSRGQLPTLIHAASLAIKDSRDLIMWATRVRNDAP